MTDRSELEKLRRAKTDAIASDYESDAGIPATGTLTGLYRHGVINLILGSVLEESQPESDVFSVAVLDVDRFDTLNRSSGYATGDRFLRHAGTAIAKTIRADDVAGHLRDNAFLIILRDTSGVDARRVVERVKHAITQDSPAPCTMTAGIASFPSCGRSAEALLSGTDAAIGDAKLRGEDRIEIFEPDIDNTDTDSFRIMIVDDEPATRRVLGAMLSDPSYEVVEFESAESALGRMRKGQVDLILSDVRMPGVDGFEFCRRVKSAESTRMIPFVLITGNADSEHRLKGIESGADDFLTKPVDRSELVARTRSLLKVRKMNRDFTNIESVLFTLINAIEAKDSYTQGHTERVASLATEVGRRMGLPAKSISALRLGGILHDIGKIGISGAVLNKAGSLTDEEWELMKSHTMMGYKICLPLKGSLGAALDIVRHHHEKLDGSSYPDGIAGDTLSIETRITAVVDMYDAMTTDRPYRPAMTRQKAIEILREDGGAGKIDPAVVAVLEAVVHADADIRRRDDSPSEEAGKRVLVIEDDELNMKLVRTILQLEGYRVIEATDAESGIRKAQDERPNLILMDIQLPGMDGITAAKTIKDHEELAKVPIVALSSYAMRSDINNAMEAGFVDYITKPLDTKSFPDVVANVLAELK